MRPALGLVLALLTAAAPGAAAEQVSAGPRLDVVGTSFRVTMPDGRVLTSPDLVGAVLEAADEAGRRVAVRVEGVERDPSDADGEIWLHRLSVVDPRGGPGAEFCAPGPDGVAAGFPLAGRWTADGRHLRDPAAFTLTCTSGVSGKCVRAGYKPWREAPAGGEALWDYHQACTRLLRADYGGDGAAHTREGTQVDLFDRLHINRPEAAPTGLEFEAAWGPDGAVCVRRTRVPEVLSNDELARRYPRLAGRIGPGCSEAVPALLWNRS